jgi:hypothetical protein
MYKILSAEGDNLEDEILGVKTVIKWAYRSLALVKSFMSFRIS